MRSASRLLAVLSALSLCISAYAQDVQREVLSDRPTQDELVAQIAEQGSVPKLVKFSGALRDAEGKVATGAVRLTFAVYKTKDDVDALWTETRTVTLDAEGRYTVLLGATKADGIDANVFSTGEARYVGVQIEGRAELSRTLMVSVPYALKAADAEKLGGLGIGDFVLTRATRERLVQQSGANGSALGETFGAISSTANTTGRIAKFTGADVIGDSLISESGSNIGIGTSTPNEQLELTGNFRTPASTATTGIWYQGPNRFVHTAPFGSGNLFFGVNAGNFTNTGTLNVGLGTVALGALTTGSSNLALGSQAMANNTTGAQNSAIGTQALFNSNGNNNVAIGFNALVLNTTGGGNTSIGTQSGQTNGTGTFNTLIGYNADVNANNLTNAMALGANARVNTSNSIVLGNGANVAIGTSAPAFTTGGGAHIFNSSVAALRLQSSGGSYEMFSINNGNFGLFDTTSSNYRLYVTAAGNTGIGTTTPTNKLEVAGTIKSTTGGFVFPDGTIQLSAAATCTSNCGGTITGVTAGNGLTGGGTTGAVSLAVNTATIQARVTGSCAAGQYVRSVNADGSVVCGMDASNAGTVTSIATGTGLTGGPITGSGTIAVDSTVARTNAINIFNASQTMTSDLTVSGIVSGGKGYFFGTDTGGVELRAEATGTGETTGLYAKATSPDGVAGVFESSAGTILRGKNGSGEVFRVDQNGYVWTPGLRDLNGNPYSFITNISGGSGVSVDAMGSFVNVSLSPNVAFKNTNNNFSAAQTVTGSISASGTNAIVLSPSNGTMTIAGDRFLSAPGNHNSFFGPLAGNLSVTGSENVAVGKEALTAVTSAFGNTAVGRGALKAATTADANTALGVNTLISLVSGGSGNVALGSEAMQGLTSGNNNIAIGRAALPFAFASGSSNIAIGFAAGGGLNTNSDNSIFIGDNARANSAGLTNAIAIGVNAVVNDSNTMILGNGVNVGINVGSPTEKLAVGGNILATGTITATNGFSGSLSGASSIALAATTGSTAGVITQDGQRFIHSYGTNNFFAGNQAGSFLAGGGNTGVGAFALANAASGTRNVAVGDMALQFNHHGEFNTAVGSQSLRSNTVGESNTAMGTSALFSNVDGFDNTAMGVAALFSNTGGHLNVALGRSALLANTSGGGNVAVGYKALLTNSTGGSNVSVGPESLSTVTTGSHNIGIGSGAGAGITSGGGNIFIGGSAVANSGDLVNAIAIGVGTTVTASNTMVLGNGVNVGIGTSLPSEKLQVIGKVKATGFNGNYLELPLTFDGTTGVVTQNGSRFLHSYGLFDNLFMGRLAGNFTNTGSKNVGLGTNSLTAVTSGFSNTAIGYGSIQNVTSGAYNVGVGESVLALNSAGQWNTAVGTYALNQGATGTFNTAIGGNALFSNTADGNTAVGMGALDSNSSGEKNAALGLEVMSSNTTGSRNAALGYGALFLSQTGTDNVGVGNLAGRGNAGSFNTFVGSLTGGEFSATSGNNNTFVGYNSSGSSGVSNATAIGANAQVATSNAMVLGDSSVKVGIGVSNPKSKLEVSGDVYLNGPGAGVILRATDNFTCFRVTVNSSGTLTATSITCP